MLRKILVTGVSGFVGGALARCLELDQSRRVRGAVRSAGTTAPAGVEIVEVGDLSSTTRWDVALNGVECVIHLAAKVHQPTTLGSASIGEYHEVNVAATVNLARQSAVRGVRRFVFMSSVKVHGQSTSTDRPFVETDVVGQTDALTDPYGWSKAQAEKALQEVARDTGLELVIVRSPLVYGVGVKANFASLMQTVAKGIPLPMGAVRNRRSLIALDNLVDFLVSCVDHPAASGEAFLVSDGQDVSTPELIRRIGNAVGRPARLIAVPTWVLSSAAQVFGRQDLSERLLCSLLVDITKARNTLGWVPPITMDEGLLRATAPLRVGRRA